MALSAVSPMMATAAPTLPTGPDWSYEVKWDGYRAQAVKRGNSVSLASRNLKNISRQFPSVVRAVAGLSAKDVVLDGEIVALDGDGRPSFQALHHVELSDVSIVYYAFDLLHLDGRDFTREPLDLRRVALRKAVSDSAVLLSDALPGTPQQITNAVRDLGLEGIVAKRRKSIYLAGRRSDSWVKVRFARRQELVIGGYKGLGETFDSILVGYYNGKKLMAAGKVRAGFTPHLRAQLAAALKPLVTARCPFANLPSARSSHWGEGITAEEMLELTWVKPKLVAEISFTEWTRDGSLRHAAFIGLRDDKRAVDVIREDSSRT
jgi:bifunctional non-homologous end joining protein LigD